MKNITVKEYSQLTDVSAYKMLEMLAAKNSFLNKQMNINAMPYSNVKYCIKIIYKTDSWEQIRNLFQICYGVNEKEFWNAGIIEYYQSQKYIIESFIAVVDNENKMFSSNNTDENLWKMAGAERLNPFNDTLPLLNLGKAIGMYPFDLGRKPYGEVLTLLIAIKIQGEVESDYQRLKMS